MSNYRTIKLTSTHRVMMLGFMICQLLAVLWGFCMLFNYFLINFLPNYYPSLVSGVQLKEKLPLFQNSALYLLFWLQHIIMATLKYKKMLFYSYPSYILYERYIFNIASALTLWFIFANAKPVNHVIFTIPFFAHFPPLIIGTIFLVVSLIQLGYPIFVPYNISDIISAEELRYIPYESKADEGLKTNGLYAYSRNPMQAGFLLMIFFASGVFTTDRLLFIVIMSSGILYGVFLQEKRMKTMFSQYPDYMKKVTARYIPYLI